MDWKDVGIGWGIFTWWTVTVVSLAGFILRINMKSTSNCEAIKDLQEILNPKDHRSRLITISQCQQARGSCEVERSRITTELKNEVLRNNQDMERHLDGIYHEMQVMNGALVRLATQLEERSGTSGRRMLD
jgi:hypothetical protein